MTDPFYNSTAWKQVREAVKRRDGYRCTVCGISYGRLDVDHIEPVKQRPDLALDPANLRTLCRTCHNRKPGRHARPARKNSRQW